MNTHIIVILYEAVWVGHKKNKREERESASMTDDMLTMNVQ